MGAWCNALLSHVDAKALPHNALTNFTRNFMFSLGRVEAFQAAWFGMRVVQVPPGQLYAESWDRVGGKVILVLVSVIFRCERESPKTGDKGSRC